jgi:hypothetical protein
MQALFYHSKQVNNMDISKDKILQNICYTELVYERINKKLNTKFSNEQIEKLMPDIIQKTNEKTFEKTGKNYYITNIEHSIRITVNSGTFRIITVDKIENNIKEMSRLCST